MTESIDPAAPVASVAVSDITIERIAVRSCRFEDHLFEQAVLQLAGSSEKTPGPDKIRLSAKVTVWISTEPQFAIVRLLIGATPHSQPSWSASIEVVGKYSCGENPVIPLERFAWNNGIAYLVPYVRERLANMTGASVFGAFVLPPLSVSKLIELSKQTSEATAPASDASAPET